MLYNMLLYLASNPFSAGDTLSCDRVFEHAKHITVYLVPMSHIFKIF